MNQTPHNNSFQNKFPAKFLTVLVSVCLIFGAANSIVARQRAAETPEQTVTKFYSWYLHELNAERDPRTEKAKLLKYVSRRLARWFKTKQYREWDADYFIDAQDFDREWEQTISVSKAIVKGNAASLVVTLGVYKTGRKYNGIGKHVLPVKMVREAGVWKIDRVGDY